MMCFQNFVDFSTVYSYAERLEHAESEDEFLAALLDLEAILPTREFRLEAILSGTRLRGRLQRVELPPPQCSRREVAALLLQRATLD